MTRPATPARYVEQHLDLLTAYSNGTKFRPWFTDPDDYLQDLVLQVLAKHHLLRANTGKVCTRCGGNGCSTWLGWQARAVLRDQLRKHKRKVDREGIEVPMHAAADLVADAEREEREETQAQVARVLQAADFGQIQACVSLMAGHDAATVRVLLGIGIHQRNKRLAELAQVLQAQPPERGTRIWKTTTQSAV